MTCPTCHDHRMLYSGAVPTVCPTCHGSSSYEYRKAAADAEAKKWADTPDTTCHDYASGKGTK